MLTIDDCIALSDLTEEEVDAIAEHEHLPEMVAVELGSYLVHTVEGQRRIAGFIRDDIAHARAHGNHRHAATLVMVLRHFMAGHQPARLERNQTG
ncbi:hypothetical protein HL658_00275 [Azospirillum sp. RWY-5-1]|uniref:Uncharacterized protein n=1 Tax=Azospirillum oleiclasticum TaxID=2735135 RepID=A0ABX2T1N6_9PROT|nr:hypothetical protein [Azospirillum oleiclasticum]NYZ10967.1 hypothetical protein [Azospirillum oleiclasticum]NYZ18129.1 hypothetical protein [Azospirillum oleiclasticum]